MNSRIVKKHSLRFVRPHSDRYKRIKRNWRKPKGIDSCVRRKYRGKPIMPNIGYGTKSIIRNTLPCGAFKIRIHNHFELDRLVTFRNKFAVEIAHGVNIMNKKKILRKALEMDLKIINIPTSKKFF